MRFSKYICIQLIASPHISCVKTLKIDSVHILQWRSFIFCKMKSFFWNLFQVKKKFIMNETEKRYFHSERTFQSFFFVSFNANIVRYNSQAMKQKKKVRMLHFSLIKFIRAIMIQSLIDCSRATKRQTKLHRVQSFMQHTFNIHLWLLCPSSR